MRRPMASGCALWPRQRPKKPAFCMPGPVQLRGAAAVFGSAAGLASPVVLFLGAGLVAALGFAGLEAGLAAAAAGFAAAASGLALACLAPGLMGAFGSIVTETLVSDLASFASAVSTGFLPAARPFLPRRGVCFSESTATAAISAGPVLVGPV